MAEFYEIVPKEIEAVEGKRKKKEPVLTGTLEDAFERLQEKVIKANKDKKPKQRSVKLLYNLNDHKYAAIVSEGTKGHPRTLQANTLVLDAFFKEAHTVADFQSLSTFVRAPVSYELKSEGAILEDLPDVVEDKPVPGTPTESAPLPAYEPPKASSSSSKPTPKSSSSLEEEEETVKTQPRGYAREIAPKLKKEKTSTTSTRETSRASSPEPMADIDEFNDEVADRLYAENEQGEIESVSKTEAKEAIKDGYDVYKIQKGISDAAVPIHLYADLMKLTEKGELSEDATAEISMYADDIKRGGVPTEDDVKKLIKALASPKNKKKMKARGKTKHEILEQLETMQKKTGLK
jgi:hypothetical protein